MILLRHCQSEFNLHFTRTRRDPGIVDPGLTAEGLQQAASAADALSEQQSVAADGQGIARIIVSPYRRALQTATPLAAALGVDLTVSSLVRERFAFTCDVGSPRSALERDWPQLDFSALDETWWPHGATTDATIIESEESVVARAASFRALMMADADWQRVLVVSHWGFLLAFTGRSIENGQWLRVDPATLPPDPLVWRH